MLFDGVKVLLWDVKLLPNPSCSETPFNLPRCIMMMMMMMIITAVVEGSLKQCGAHSRKMNTILTTPFFMIQHF